MSDLIKIVDALEDRIKKLLYKQKKLEQQNMLLVKELKTVKSHSDLKTEQIRHWEEKFSALKNANAMLGSDEYKRETKLKINALIKEIDLCIAQLSE
ncbi:hypothetical protein [Aquimarina rhabdastrellae]